MTITWEQVLAFLCEDQTMAITSLLFLAFFAAVALINYALPRVLRPYFLLAASYGFFCYDPVNRPLVWVIAAATVLTWLCGLIIGKVRAKPVRVLALAASVGFGIGILVYYKYWNLLADPAGDAAALMLRRKDDEAAKQQHDRQTAINAAAVDEIRHLRPRPCQTVPAL